MGIITILLFVLVVWVIVFLTMNMFHIVRLKPVTKPLKYAPLVSICVPARNEQRDIGACLKSLLEQDYPRLEVIAVDDHSEDATAKIIKALEKKNINLKFINSEPLPQGWFGKSFALFQAARQAKGEYLLFTDADPVFDPRAITTAVNQLFRRA